jgi:hypothetical protein
MRSESSAGRSVALNHHRQVVSSSQEDRDSRRSSQKENEPACTTTPRVASRRRGPQGQSKSRCLHISTAVQAAKMTEGAPLAALEEEVGSRAESVDAGEVGEYLQLDGLHF